MIGEVKDAFKRNLPNLKWMDDETRQAAMDKVSWYGGDVWYYTWAWL